MQLKPVVKAQTDILNRFRLLNPVDDKKEREEMMKRLKDLKREEDRIRELPNEDLFKGSTTVKEYDWMKISAQGFNGYISAQSCK